MQKKETKQKASKPEAGKTCPVVSVSAGKTRKVRIDGKRKHTKEIPLLDLSSYPHDEKGNAIVPDSFFEENLKSLPNGTRNASMTHRAFNGGKLYSIGSDPVKDAEIVRAGAEASNAMQAQRKTFAEMLDVLLRKKDDSGLTYQEKILLAMADKAATGDTKAAVFVRDTIGEMPVSKQEIRADVMTDADRSLIEKLQKRIDENK